MRQTIRVLFANCPKLDDDAAAYLILAQNAVQNVLEFEIDHLFVHASQRSKATFSKFAISWMDSPRVNRFLYRLVERKIRARIERKHWPLLKRELPYRNTLEPFAPLIADYNLWLSSLQVRYGGWSIRRAPTVIVTETPMEGGYLSMVGSDFAIVSLGTWKKYSPPSAVEFTLMSVQRAALRMVIHKDIGSHYPTRGCVWDFAAHQPDARLGVVGALCDKCLELVRSSCTEENVQELQKLLAGKWLGKPEDPGSPASNIRRVFGFDLSVARSIRPRLREQIWDSVKSPIGASLIAAAGFLLNWLLRWFGWIK